MDKCACGLDPQEYNQCIHALGKDGRVKTRYGYEEINRRKLKEDLPERCHCCNVAYAMYHHDFCTEQEFKK